MSQILFLILTVFTTACGDLRIRRYDYDAYESFEHTGGLSTDSSRVYTRTSSDSKALEQAKTSVNIQNPKDVKLASRIDTIEATTTYDKEEPKTTIKVRMEEPNEVVTFTGTPPSPKEQVSDFNTTNRTKTLRVFCSSESCGSYLGILEDKNNGAKGAFVIRSANAKARILFLGTSDIQVLTNRFGSDYPALPLFLKAFSTNQNVEAFLSEVALGKSRFQLKIHFKNFFICIEGDALSTDQTDQPLPPLRVTCGENYLPITAIRLVGNAQDGRIALRFELKEDNDLDLYVDLNGKDIDFEPAPPKKTEPQPIKIVPSDRAFISVNLKNKRTSEIYSQFMSDFPSNHDPNLSREQRYGQDITAKWIRRWQGEKLDIPLCFKKDKYSKINFTPTLAKFFANGKPKYEKIKKFFDENDVPSNFFYTVVVESPKFFDNPSVTNEVSSAKAVGPWQFTEKTAKHLGLKVYPFLVNGMPNPKDERTDFMKASKTAIQYYDHFLDHFSDYKLALAAYNQGAGGVFSFIRKAVSAEEYEQFYKKTLKTNPKLPKPSDYRKRIKENFEDLEVDPKQSWSNLALAWGDKAPTYWFLHEFHMMPCETREYIPKLVSAMIIGENPQAYGF